MYICIYLSILELLEACVTLTDVMQTRVRSCVKLALNNRHRHRTLTASLHQTQELHVGVGHVAGHLPRAAGS